jgi:uncharacterized LabA/DUF88 family protein
MPTPIPQPPEPATKRTVVFFDGQNLFHAAKEAFGYREANYDVVALARRVCGDSGWLLSQVRFYTGVPTQQEDPRAFQFWNAKLQGLRNARVEVFQRPLRYRTKDARLPLTMDAARRAKFRLPDGSYLPAGAKLYLDNGQEVPDGTRLSVRVGEEKGIDVRLALDLIRLTLDGVFDIAVLFTQDQDMAEAAKEVAQIASRDQRWVKVYSAFPEGGTNSRGVDNTQWIKIDGATYASCLDRRDYNQNRRR